MVCYMGVTSNGCYRNLDVTTWVLPVIGGTWVFHQIVSLHFHISRPSMLLARSHE